MLIKFSDLKLQVIGKRNGFHLVWKEMVSSKWPGFCKLSEESLKGKVIEDYSEFLKTAPALQRVEWRKMRKKRKWKNESEGKK